ncbi:MAG: hypothetical protein Q8Q98_15820 [Polaromonas sp.]|nr:hypothetical protein [Polaromonas sp.]
MANPSDPASSPVNGYVMHAPIELATGTINGIELQDRDFLAAIQNETEPVASFSRVLSAYRTLDRAEKSLEGGA